jgi:hypothetical protein
MMKIMVSFSAFVILIVSSWHWARNKGLKRPTFRGLFVGIFGVALC